MRCARGGGLPPELGELVTLRATEGGGLPVHATAFACGRRGVVVTGGSGAGKTGVLLAALARGATLVAAEHVVISPDGVLYGRREAVRLRPRHRHLLPPTAGPAPARRLAAWHPLTSATAALARHPVVPARVADRLRDVVRDRAFSDVPASAFVASRSPVTLDTLVLLEPTDGREVLEISGTEAEEMSARLTALLRGELAGLRSVAAVDSGGAGRVGHRSLDHAESTYRDTAESLLPGRRLLLVRTPPGGLSSPLAAELADHIIDRGATTA